MAALPGFGAVYIGAAVLFLGYLIFGHLTPRRVAIAFVALAALVVLWAVL